MRLGAAEVEVNLEVALQDPLGFFAERVARMPATLRERPLAVRMFVFMDEGHSHPGLVPEAHALLTEADAVRASAPGIEAGQRTGAIPPGPPSALSLVYWAVLLRIARETLYDSEAELPEPAWVIDLLRRGGPA